MTHLAFTATPPQKSADWLAVGDREVANVRAALLGRGSADMVCEHCCLAVEAVLKGLIWQRFRWSGWPRNRGGHAYLYHHDLEKMLDNATCRSELEGDAGRLASWQTIRSYDRGFSYCPGELAMNWAHNMARSLRDTEYGVYPWLKTLYQRRMHP
jgi:HEPN domain-containing protein